METHFDDWVAQRYERLWPELFEPAVLDPAVDFLADLADGDSALELGIGTGRVALPLARRGVAVHGIELSLLDHRRPVQDFLVTPPFPLARRTGPHGPGSPVWHRTPFTGDSRSHISVWEKPRP